MRGEECFCLCRSEEGTSFLFICLFCFCFFFFFHLVVVVTQSLHGQFQVPPMAIDKMFLSVFDVCKSSIGTPPHCSVDRATVWANVGSQPPQNSRASARDGSLQHCGQLPALHRKRVVESNNSRLELKTELEFWSSG